MATPSVPTRQLIEAMEELGLLGWLPNRRWAVRTSRRPQLEPHGGIVLRAERAPLAVGAWMGAVGGAAVAASLIAIGGSMTFGAGSNVRSGRVLRTWGTALACGVGLVSAWALMKIGGARRRAP